MSLGRLAARSLSVAISVALCVVLLAALLPASALAAPGGKVREYIVTLSVTGSGRTIVPSNRSAKQRIRKRAERADSATERIAREHGIKARHRFDSSVTGFSAKLTPKQAAEVAANPKVSGVRPARTFKLAAEDIPFGIKRVKAWVTGTTPGPDVTADVAVIDTGIGPVGADGYPSPMLGVEGGPPELNIGGGYNCTNLNATGKWADDVGHGTHVAGTIGARDNSVGTIGVAPGVRLWAVKVFANGQDGREADIICGLQWVIGTHSDPNQPDIDVVNMSMEGGRIDLNENCATVADPIQELICTATDMGISVVAAAGNSAFNANRSMPGGFDQVISVGAMTDTDGVGGSLGPNAACAGYRSEGDDTYADYSNYGTDIDIVAPGTCVLSASPSRSGDATAVMTGTSMATPHVTGAVARYLAAHPATSASLVRKITRAAGRMDWIAKSDPLWGGVGDSDQPNRVLDVKSLTGPQMIKAWIYNDTFKVGGSSTARATRVDVQRGGGYAGTVTLGVSGLPSAVGRHAFGDRTLDGFAPAQLGTRLDLNLKTSGPDGHYDLGIEANASGVSAHSRSLALTVDRTGPRITDLAARVRAGSVSMAASGAGQAFLQWQVRDALSSVKYVQLQRKTGKQAWRNAGSGGFTSSLVTLKPGQYNKFRVKATDSLGNKRTSAAVTARLSVRDSASSKWSLPPSGWKVKKVKKAYGGSLLVGSGRTGRMSTSFKGRAVAVVASVGPKRGSIQVRVDGGSWHKVSLKSSKAGHRKVVWGRRLGAGSHVLDVRSLAGQTTLDAALIIR